MIDVRDSMFQANPFSFTPELVSDPAGGAGTQDYISPSFFYAFKGVESRTIGQCGWNGGWIKDCFGMQVCVWDIYIYMYMGEMVMGE